MTEQQVSGSTRSAAVRVLVEFNQAEYQKLAEQPNLTDALQMQVFGSGGAASVAVVPNDRRTVIVAALNTTIDKITEALKIMNRRSSQARMFRLCSQILAAISSGSILALYSAPLTKIAAGVATLASILAMLAQSDGDVSIISDDRAEAVTIRFTAQQALAQIDAAREDETDLPTLLDKGEAICAELLKYAAKYGVT